jgi:hypothetical protein
MDELVSQGILRVLLDDASLGVQGEDLKSRAERVEQDGEEDEAAARVEAIRVGFCPRISR